MWEKWNMNSKPITESVLKEFRDFIGKSKNHYSEDFRKGIDEVKLLAFIQKLLKEQREEIIDASYEAISTSKDITDHHIKVCERLDELKK